MVGANDLELMQVIDEPDDIVEAIFDFYEDRGFQPTQRRAPADAQPVASRIGVTSSRAPARRRAA